MELTREQNQLLEHYSSNEMKPLKKIVDVMILRFGGIDNYELDDYYSLANMELFRCAIKYSPEKCDNFENYLKFCILNKIKQRLTYNNRIQRRQTVRTIDRNGNEEIHYIQEARLDSSICEDGKDTTMVDLLEDSKTVEDIVFEEVNSDKTEKYLKSLCSKQRRILEYLKGGYEPKQIKAEMKMSSADYNMYIEDMRSFHKVHVLY